MATLIRTIHSSQFSPPSPDPSGIAYIAHTNSLLIGDGEVDEMTIFAGKNMFDMTLSGSLLGASNATAFSKEVTGVAYDPSNRFLYISDDDRKRIFQVDPGRDGLYNTADDTVTFFSTSLFGSTDPEDVAVSFTPGELFIVDGLGSEVYRVTTGGTLLGQFDTSRLGLLDPEGIFADPVTGHLFLVGRPATKVFELTANGDLVQTIDISAANALKPAGLTIAPSSIDPNQRSLYIVDRGVDNDDVPSENDGKIYEFSLGGTVTPPPPSPGVLSFSAPTFSVSEDGTVFSSIQVTRTGGSSGAVSATISLTNGSAIAPDDYSNQSILVSFANGDTTTKTITIPIVNDNLEEGNETINLGLINPTNGATLGTQKTAVLTIVDNDAPVSSSTLYLSFNGTGTVGGVTFNDEDILAFDQGTNTWSMYFDGSDVGLTNFNLRDFHINADGTILLSLNDAITMSGLGTVDDSDILKFTPTSIGNNTLGNFDLYFKGGNVGLTTSNEEIDGIAFAPDGRLVISTKGSFDALGLTGKDADLIVFNATVLGANTAGTWGMYFDGSDVGLSTTPEDVDAAWIDGSGNIYLSAEGAYDVPGAAGMGADIFKFAPNSLGKNTLGSYSPSWIAANSGVSGVLVDGFSRLA